MRSLRRKNSKVSYKKLCLNIKKLKTRMTLAEKNKIEWLNTFKKSIGKKKRK